MSVKDGAMLIKLKDGVQDTVVFLRMLEQFKIPAVMETRRKKLLEKLLHLQGDTIREAPPSYENGEGPASPTHDEKELSRKTSFVDDKVSAYSRIQTKAKEEMVVLSPKRTTAAEDKTAAASPAPATVKDTKPENEATEYLEPSAVVQRRLKSGSPERPSSSLSAVSGEDAENKKAGEEDTDSKKGDTEQADEGTVKDSGKKKRFGLKAFKKFGKFSKKSGTADQSPEHNVSVEQQAAVATEDSTGAATAATAEVQEEVEGQDKEKEGEVEEGGGEGEGEEVEEGVRVQSELEKRVQKRFGTSWVKISGKLKGVTLTLTTGSKEKQLELIGCMVTPSDAAPNAIELFSHKEQKQWVFRVESEALREKWVEELQKAIDECPVERRPSLDESTEVNAATEEQQEKPDEEVPSIKVEPAGGEEESPVKKRASIVPSPSRNRKSKPVSEIPEKGIQIKGYVHRKKTPFGGWERTYGVVTFAAIYFTTGEDVREFHHVCMLSGTGTVKHEKKGHDKQSEGLVIRSGKNKETLSLSAADVQSWKTALEDVLGVSGSLEFDSGDEDEAVDTTTTAAVPTTTTKAPPPIEDDQGLYEELPGGEEIEEDIYEEFDDVPRVEPEPDVAPSLPPPRQEQRSTPSPALPPRNEIPRSSEPVPSLPPRSSPAPAKKGVPPVQKGVPPVQKGAPPVQKGAPPGPKKAAQPPPEDAGGEDLYEDVVGYHEGTGDGQGGDELYEDVVAPDQTQELYDDVVGAPGSPTEDYTEMDMGQQDVPAEEYVTMERVPGEDLEVYCEVDQDAPPQAPINSVTLPPKGTTKPAGAGKIMKPPPPASYVPKHTGNLSRKGPNKARFYEEWCAVEGTNLCTYKNPKDKRTVEKLSLSECDMTFSPEKDGQFSFRLSKGSQVHQFNSSNKDELNGWIGVLRGLAKSAKLELPPGEQQIFEATHDHTAESDEQISFKAGTYIRFISQDTSDCWIGQLGNSSQIFTGKIGKFPASKVALAEDLYM